MQCLGMDIGTMFVVGARPGAGGTAQISKVRDCFVLIKGNKFNQRMYTNNKDIHWMPWENGDIALVGDSALNYANSAPMALEVRRPLSKGILNKDERDAFPMLRAIVESVAGRAQGPGICTLSIPAPTIDVEYLIDHHRDVLLQILRELGWQVQLEHEGFCVVLSALETSQFSGIGLSFGGGMVNVSFSFFADELFAFSMQKAGDWVDQVAADASRYSKAEITSMKESEFSLLDNNTGKDGLWQIESAYMSLINATVENICVAFEQLEKKPRVKDPLPVAIAGGTSMVPGFVERFEKALRESRFPVPVGRVFSAQDPLFAVAKGAMVHAISTMEDAEVATLPEPAVASIAVLEIEEAVPDNSQGPPQEAPPQEPGVPSIPLPDSFGPVKRPQ